MVVNKMNLISDALKIELKQLINEVLDERKYIIMQEEPKPVGEEQ